MAASIESRVPFLDHKLVEFAAGLPVRHEAQGLDYKAHPPKSDADLLPKEILIAQEDGIPGPVGIWMRGQFGHIIDEYVLSARARERGIFDHVVRERAGNAA